MHGEITTGHDGVPRTAGFNDYKWNSATMEFDLTAATQNGAFLGVRQAGDDFRYPARGRFGFVA
jgi:hypothetical protein